MILPTKHISEDQALLGVGALLLQQLGRPHTVTSLWEAVRDNRNIGTFERFILALDLLHVIGVIDFVDGLFIREGA